MRPSGRNIKSKFFEGNPVTSSRAPQTSMAISAIPVRWLRLEPKLAFPRGSGSVQVQVKTPIVTGSEGSRQKSDRSRQIPRDSREGSRIRDSRASRLYIFYCFALVRTLSWPTLPLLLRNLCSFTRLGLTSLVRRP